MWAELFETGKQTDSNGWANTWTTGDIDDIVANSKGEKPITIEHPGQGKLSKAAAWGWFDGFKREGDKLFGNISDLVPEFAVMLKNKMFPKRSVGLVKRKDGWELDHVAFLGKKAPAVKGLADIAFSASASTFQSDTENLDVSQFIKENTMDLKEIQAKLDEATSQIASFEAEKTENAAKLAAVEAKFTALEAEADKAKNDGVELTAVKNKLAFAKKQNEDLKKSVDAINSQLKSAEFEAFFKEVAAVGKALPAEKDDIMVIMESLDGQEPRDFATADGKTVKKTVLSIYQNSIRNRVAVMDFSEQALNNQVRLDEKAANAELKQKMIEYADSHKMNLGENVRVIQEAVFAANPKLKAAVIGA
jgi:hypothetical protein